MSTAGKVLTGLVTVVLLGCLILLAMVAQLNSNWGEAIAKQEEQIRALRGSPGAPGQVEKAQADLRKAKDNLVKAQLDHQYEVTVLRAQVADRERLLTDAIEALERATNQVEGQQTALKAAELGRQRRQDELAATNQALADARREVEQLTARNGELMAQLDRLRKEFMAVLQENRRLIGEAAE